MIQFGVLMHLAPVFLFPSEKFIWLLLVIPVILLFRLVSQKTVFPETFLSWPLLLLLIQVFATCLIVPDLMFSLPKITGIIFGILFFYALFALLKNEKVLKRGLLAFVFGGIFFSLFGLLGINWDYDSLVFSVARLIGIPLDKTAYTREVIPALEKMIPRVNFSLPGAETGFNGNAIGGAIILVFPVILALFLPYLRKKTQESRIWEHKTAIFFLLLGLVILSGVLFLTLSVACWAALALSLWIIFFSKKWKAITAVALFSAILLFLLFFPAKVSRFGSTIKNELDPEKVEYRIKWWNVAVQSIREHPLFGVGANRIRLHRDIGYERAHVHNQYLQTAAELGMPALAAYLALLAGIFLMCLRIWRKAEKSWIKKAAMGLGCGQLAFGLFGLVDAIPLGAKVGIFFWLSLALIAALYKQEKLKVAKLKTKSL